LLLPNLSASGSITMNDKEIRMDGYPDFEALIENSINEAISNAMGMPMPDAVPVAMGEGSVIQEKWDKQLGLTANMAILNPRSIPLIINSYDNYEASQLNGGHTRNELLFAVTQTYYTVRSAKESLKVALQDLQNADAFLELAKRRKKVGAATDLDVLRAEIEQIKAEESKQNASDSLTLAKTALSYLTGMSGKFDIVEVETPEPVKGDLESLQARALSDRKDLKSAFLQLEIVERNRAESWVKYLPSFDATYNYSWSEATGFSGEHDSWRLIFGARWSLFEGGSRIVEIMERSSQMVQTSNQVKQLKLDIKEQVETAKLQINKHKRNLLLANKQLVLAEDNHRRVQKRYEQGLATSLDVLDANTTLSKANMNVIFEKLQYELAVLKLNKSCGEYLPLAASK